LVVNVTSVHVGFPRVQLLAATPEENTGFPRMKTLFPEQAASLSAQAAEKAKQKRKDLNLPKYLCSRVSACVITALVAFLCGISGTAHSYVTPVTNIAWHTDPQPRPPSSAPYPICAAQHNNVSIIDLALFASMMYSEVRGVVATEACVPFAECVVVHPSQPPGLLEDFYVYFPMGDWVWLTSSAGRNISSNFYEFYNARLNTSVITLRGNTAHSSVLADYELWIEATVYQCMLLLLPGFSFVPRDVCVHAHDDVASCHTSGC
jgi:hypothetical protein